MAGLDRKNPDATGKCCCVDDNEEANVQAMIEADMAESCGCRLPTNREQNEGIVVID